MKVSDIQFAKYNPRKMSKESKEALKKSIEQFNDISGITINKQTGNVLAGNHRWEQLCKKYTKSNLELKHLQGEYYTLNTTEDEFTGFLVRVVDWDIAKEKAANVAANSELIAGEFTSGLQDVLLDIGEFELFEGLRFDELQIDLSGVDDDLVWDDDSLDEIQKSAEEKNDRLPDAKNSEVKEIRVEIKVSVPADMKDEIKDDLLEFLADQPYYGEITIV